MATEAFALSPISARATQPSDEDYEAIREAFMETARGRWFLNEYAKRNRNADTSMVLDAVVRIEETLAAQRQPPPPPPEDKLPEALAAIRNVVEQAGTAASKAVDELRLEDNLAPIRRGSRIIKEISWRWREIGADSRICDLIDSQVAAIEAACGQLSSVDASAALDVAFDLIRTQLDSLSEGSPAAAAEPAQAPGRPAPPPPANEARSPTVEVLQEVFLNGNAGAAAETKPLGAMEPEGDVVADETTAHVSAEAADAHDEVVLELVALEMAAPDTDGDYVEVPVEPSAAVAQSAAAAETGELEPAAGELEIDDPTLFEPETVAPIGGERAPEPAPEPSAAQPAAAVVASPPSEPALQPATEPPQEISLGSTILSSGILKKHANDPLAPIRRMTQAEKIAFFS